jgi:thiol:disulfide interchange protein DsbD
MNRTITKLRCTDLSDLIFRRLVTVAAMLLAGLTLSLRPASAAAQLGLDSNPTVAVTAKASVAEIAPGGQLAVAVILDHGSSLHSWPSEAQDVLPEEFSFAIRTSVDLVERPSAVAGVGPAQWPEPHPAAVANITGEGPPTVEVLTYTGRVIVYLPLLIAENAPVGTLTLPIAVRLQACDDAQCYMPQDEQISVQITVTRTPGASAADPDFGAFDASVFADAAAWSTGGGVPAQAEAPSQGVAESATPAGVPPRKLFLNLIPLPEPGTPGFLLGMIGFGLLGGFILNLTPCVLPVIPIKVMTLTQHAGGSRSRTLMLGMTMALGVVAFWSLLAVPVLTVQELADPSRIFGIWWLTAGIGAVIVVMSLGLMGLFHINLPQKAYMINPKADTPSGSFMFGVMTAVLGLPCFGFVVGALLPLAASSDSGSLVVVSIFVSMGVGMAAPYLVLSLYPGLLKRVPKTGPASDLVKQIMGLLLMGAGAYFIGAGLLALTAEYPYLAKVLHWWAAGLLVASAGVWLVYRTVRITPKAAPRAVFGLIAVLLAAAGVWVADNQTDQARSRWQELQERQAATGRTNSFVTGVWNSYDPETLQAAMASGKVVVLDFTAEWCLNCKALKAAVLNVEPVKSALMSDEVIAFEVDLTARSASGWDKLRELGQTGIPTLAVFGPGLQSGPWIANAYGSDQVLSALEAAGADDIAAR